jgi:hypothetical protein
MIEYIKSEYRPLLIGFLVYWALYAGRELYGNLLVQTGIIKIDPSTESWNWHPSLILTNILATLLLVLPGFTAGWLSKEQGLINGIFVVTVCHIARFFIFAVNHETLHFDFSLLIILGEQLMMPVTVGAVSGCAGQLFYEKRGRLITSPFKGRRGTRRP